MTISNQDLFRISNTSFPIQDVTNKYISILEMPQYFGQGKNSFLIGVRPNSFKKDTLLNVFFLDNHNNNIPVTVTQFRQKQYIRCYIDITSQDIIGNGKLIILGVLSSDNAIVPQKYKNTVNIKHQRIIYVNPNYKTPSVLRFYSNPKVQFNVDQKQLFKYQTVTRQQNLPIKSITIEKDYPGYFCLNVDETSINKTSSVYYQKFLQQQYITTSLSQSKALNKLYSGSSFSQSILNGDYYGSIEFNTTVQQIKLKNGNFSITNSYFNIGGINPGVQYISGRNIDEIKLTYSQSVRQSKTKTQYQLYVKNSNGLQLGYIEFDQQQRYSGSTQYLKLIDYDIFINSAQNITVTTDYFSGSLYNTISSSASITKSVYSQNLYVSYNKTTMGHYRDLDIKKVQKYQQQLLISQKTYKSFQFYGDCIFTSSGKTIFKNCFISNSYLNLNLNNQKITFDLFTGSIYSKRLITENQYQAQRGYQYSFISGSLRGKGSLTVISSTTLNQYNSKQKRFSPQQVIILSQGQQFTGVAYNVNIQLQYFTGSIKKGTLTNTQDTKVLKFNQDINIKQAIIYGGIGTKVQLKNVQQLQFRDKGSINYPQSFIFDGGITSLQFSQQITFNKTTDKLLLNGNFTYTGSQTQSIDNFIGIYKPENYLNLQLYSIQKINLTGQTQKLFNTNQAYIFNNDYSKIYSPIGLSSKRGIPLDTLLNRLQNKRISVNYSYLNTLNKVIKITNPDIVPLKVIISNIDLYSGFLSQAQLYYNNTNNIKNYQLISTFQINQLQNAPITASIQIPKQYFVNQTNQFVLKYKDSKNRYCPQQNFFRDNNVSFDFQQIYRTYNTKLVQKDLSVNIINGKTGDVTLTPYDLQYYSNDLAVQTYNVGKLFDTYIDSWQHDAGVVNSPELFTSSNGNIIIGPGQYLVYQGESYASPLIRHSISAYTTFSATPSSCSYSQCLLSNKNTNYIVFSQQKGYLYVTTNRNNIDVGHIIPVVTAYKDGTDIHMLDFFQLSKGLPQRLFQRFVRTRRFQPQQGTLIIGQTASSVGATSSVITITPGYMWYGANRVPMTSSNSQIHNAKLYYRTTGGWLTSSLSTYDNLHYNANGTSLVTLNPNKFNVNWIYRTIHQNQSRLIVVLSDKQYVSSGQAAKSSPTYIPDILNSQGVLVGRAIFEKGATSASVIQSAFDTSFAVGGGGISSGGLTYFSYLNNDSIKGLVSDPGGAPQLQLWLDRITVSAITCSGNIHTNGQLSSSVTNGTSPFIISSTTLVNNLNAQYINGTSSSQIPIFQTGIQNHVTRWNSANTIAPSSILYDDGIIFTCSKAFTASSGIYISSQGLQSLGDISGSAKLTINGSSSFKNNVSVDGNLTIQQGHGLFEYSDRNLKQNIIKITKSTQILSRLNGIKFDWIKTKLPDYGMIAQQVQKVIPQMVFEQGQYKQINYIKLVPFLLQGIKQLNKRIIQLESKMNIYL